MLAPPPPAPARVLRAVRLLSRARAADTKQIPAGLEKEVAVGLYPIVTLEKQLSNMIGNLV